MAGEFTSYNAVVSYATSQGGPYTNLSKARLVKPADWMRGTVVVRGTTDQYPQNLPGWIDFEGPLQIELYLTKTLIASLVTLFNETPGAANYWWKLTFQQLASESVSASYLQGEGFLSKIGWSSMEQADNNAVTLPCEIVQSGQWTFNAGS